MSSLHVTSDSADLTAAMSTLARGLTLADWVCLPGFLPAQRSAALQAEAERLRAGGAFRAAGIGHVAELREEVRGDEILWLGDAVRAPEAERLLREELVALQRAINAETFLGLDEFEGHYAAYPPGAAYARHLDRFREENQRVVSLVLYLNPAWAEQDGGELRLYADASAPAAAATIQPRAGTLVCFLSERVPHEVMASRRTRLRLTGWFRRRA